VKLHSPGFERTLRQQVKQAVRRSPELKREFRQAKGSRRHYNLLQVLRPFYGVVLALGIWATVQATGHMVAGLAVINLWLLTLLCAQVPALLTRFYAAPELHTLILLPLSRAQIFRWQLQKHFRQSFYALLDLVIAFGALAYLNGFAAWQWPATLLVAVLAWVLLLALIAFCAARFPRRPFQMVFHGLIVMGLVFFYWPGLARSGGHHRPRPWRAGVELDSAHGLGRVIIPVVNAGTCLVGRPPAAPGCRCHWDPETFPQAITGRF